MDRPDQRRNEREPAPFCFLEVPTAQEFVREKKEREGRAEVAKNAREMITGGYEDERRIISQVGQALNWPVKILRRRIDEKKMLERFWDELPAADKRVPQDQRGIIPDEIVPQRRRVGGENGDGQKKRTEKFSQRRRFGWTEAIRCASRFGKCLSRNLAVLWAVWWRWS